MKRSFLLPLAVALAVSGFACAANAADIAKGRISVLTPVGAALIGLRPGQSIEWATRTGEIRRLTLLVGADLPSG